MPLVPSEWNAIVVGYWNRAILTPQGVAERLLEAPEETEVNIDFPIDSIVPPRITYSGMAVIVGSNQLVAQPVVSDFPSLERAKRIAHRAMSLLQETPVSAAGFNIRYRASEITPDLEPIAAMLDQPWGNAFGSEYPATQRQIGRKVQWEDGTIFVQIGSDRGQLRFSLNFERAGTAQNRADWEAMLRWLSKPIDQVQAQAETILFRVLNIDREVFGG